MLICVQVRATGKRPREAYTETLLSIAKKFRSSQEQEAVLKEFQSYNEVRSQLVRHRAVRCIPVPDPLCIPEALGTTLRGRSVSDDDVNRNEQFLLHEGQKGKLLVFCAMTELAIIHQSKYLICDGTFEMSPDTAYQIYTIHGMFKDEGLPLLWALLPNKSTATYTELFTAVRTALLSKFGSVGESKTFLLDFEIAAVNSIQTVFPDSTVKGCSFHLGRP